jgi:L-lysine 2,3-aminomutase (EC 5.4.3.2)
LQNLEENFWQKIHLYKDISNEQWQDWKWQIANRITSLNELKQIIPIKTKKIS